MHLGRFLLEDEDLGPSLNVQDLAGHEDDELPMITAVEICNRDDVDDDTSVFKTINICLAIISIFMLLTVCYQINA